VTRQGEPVVLSHGGGVLSLAVLADGRLASGGEDGEIKLWLVDGKNCMTLDAQIAADAATAPGVLPLLSYTLKTLYARDVEQAGGSTLTWQTYRELGGLQGGRLAARRRQSLHRAMARPARS
jgi:hypothetical protein